MVQLAHAMVCTRILNFKFFWVVEVLRRSIHNHISEFAQFCICFEFSIGSWGSSSFPQKMSPYVNSVLYLKSKRNKQHRMFCGVGNSFCITKGLFITQVMIVGLLKSLYPISTTTFFKAKPWLLCVVWTQAIISGSWVHVNNFKGSLHNNYIKEYHLTFHIIQIFMWRTCWR